MSQDSEKRFHSIMDKLFQNAQSSPNSNSASSASSSSSPSGVQLSRGKKRPYSSSALVVGELRSKSDVIEALQKHSSASVGSSDAPLCRPWDRGDLLKRLATFKSMTWFGKPKVVNAINCARRGWVNVDTDTIACESCGARLLFSTPSSWNQQQVEKAALVFSLKLDNGHKLLCPWIDNACDEALADFPPTPPPVLVNKFRERYSMLLHLSALPVISSSFLKWMNSPHLMQFIEELTLGNFGNESLDKSEMEYLGDGHDSDTPKVYYQALKLISLFGWEPRSVPYIVNCKSGGSDQSLKKSTTFDSHPTVSLFTTATKENVDGNRIAELSSELQSQPNSVVLDCRLCGASVGLWTFHTIPRPVEIIRLVGPTELNSESGTHDSGNKSVINHAGIGSVGISKLTSTIAGGPTPARQSFKATITLPVIGQSLRARLFNDEKFSDQVYNDQEMVQADSSDRKLSENSKSNEDTTPSGQTDQPEDGRLLQNQTIDPGCGTSGDDQTSLLEGTSVTDQGTLPQSSLNGSTEETQVKSTECVPAQKIEALENAENSIKSDSGNKVADLYPLASPVENPLMSTDAVMITSSECSEKELPSDVSDQCDSQQVSENDNSNSKEVSLADSQVTPCKSSRLEDDTNTDVAGMEESMKDKLRSDNRTTSENQAREGGDPNDKVHTSVNSMHLAHGGEDYSKGVSLGSALEFDPIRQHRYFCPWIATGNVAPGWKQTLTALQREKSSSPHSPKNSPSASLIKVNDPVTSVRNLFTSSAKKLKSSLISNERTKH
ncbi:C3HC zinc finger-like, putative isoform 1 [Cucumis melo var. makuwa]|uniref:C3HC zinc finger-like, putative isoform 1 n=1 Tax=Cucumis melo var. makuwa TaxID=1194695 RepID=A0A5D3BI62_CUCMM|nr:C3HC zinc finger-like, putative isoform 1 [Cucumis melo var. makuwa]